MYVGKVYCPEILAGVQSPNWFQMYINPKCCQYSQVLQVFQYAQDLSIAPGMIGKVIFRSRSYVAPEVDACCVKMSDMYNLLFDTTGDHSQWFKDQIKVL